MIYVKTCQQGPCQSTCPGVNMGMFTGFGLSRASNNGDFYNSMIGWSLWFDLVTKILINTIIMILTTSPPAANINILTQVIATMTSSAVVKLLEGLNFLSSIFSNKSKDKLNLIVYHLHHVLFYQVFSHICKTGRASMTTPSEVVVKQGMLALVCFTLNWI